MTTDNKKLLARLMALTLAAGAVGYEIIDTKQNSKIDVSFNVTVEEFQDDTMLDEAMSEGLASYENMDIASAADLFADHIKLYKLIENSHYKQKQKNSIDNDQKNIVDNLTYDDTLKLINSVEEKEKYFSNEQKEKYSQIINYIGTKNKKWLDDNAKDIVTSTLLWTIKSSVAEQLQIPVEKIQDIELPHYDKYKDFKLCITYDNVKYKIPITQGPIVNTVYFYYQAKSIEKPTEEDYKLLELSINSAKILTMTGIKEENNTLKSKRNLKEAKKVLKK